MDMAANTPPTDDTPTNRRPRDARLIHALLSSQGVTSYQERVPLMLIDYAYRYTRAVLSDASSLDAEGYGTAPSENRRGKGTDEGVSLTSLRIAVASRQAGQVGGGVEKRDLKEMGGEMNRIGLPRVEREFGVRLPEERFVMTGAGWSLKEEWMEEEEIDDDEDEQMQEDEDAVMQDQQEEEEEGEGGVLDVDEDMDDDEFEQVMGKTE